MKLLNLTNLGLQKLILPGSTQSIAVYVQGERFFLSRLVLKQILKVAHSPPLQTGASLPQGAEGRGQGSNTGWRFWSHFMILGEKTHSPRWVTESLDFGIKDSAQLVVLL